MKELALFVQKMGTIFADRRFWVAAFSLIGIVFGIPALTSQADNLSGQVVDAGTLVFQGISGLAIVLQYAWALNRRSPSGLDYKKTQMIEALAKYLEASKEK